MKQLIRDKNYTKGFTLSGICSNEQGLRPFDLFGDSPSWRICQWGNRYNLATTDSYLKENEKSLYPPCGRVEGKERFLREKGDFLLENDVAKFKIEGTSAHFELSGREQYPSPRKDGEAWAHLLLEQFFKGPKLSESKEIEVVIDYSVDRVENLMGDSFDSNLHTCQFQLYFMLGGKDGEKFWFGLSLFDYRYPQGTDVFHFVDGGKADNTGLYIYSVGSKQLGVAKMGSYRLAVDIIPLVRSAVQTAHEDGFIPHTDFNDLEFESMNIGWELQGTFEAGATLKEISVVLK